VTDALDFDETSHVLDDNPVLHYHEAGSGEAFVLLHGSGPGVSGWSNFKNNMPVFAKQFRTIVPDMPGFGRSPLGEIDRRYTEIVSDAMVTLLDRLGIEKTHLLGNSMGAAAAVHFSLDHPERVERLVLMGPPGVNVIGPLPSEGRKRLNEFVKSPSREGMRAWIETMVFDSKIVTDQLVDERMANAIQPGVNETAARIFDSLEDPRFADATPNWALTHKLRQPTLVTWGRDDRMVPLEVGLMPFRRMPNAELHIFSRCGHWAQVERKDEFERLVLEFLTR
jgi:4,5:9,10-diseco-3-hydroxy-5,9,17-trioxoandrosta-1(10),2-diene-4-oate hydrolase